MKKKLLLVAILCMSIVVGIPLVSYGKQKEEMQYSQYLRHDF